MKRIAVIALALIGLAVASWGQGESKHGELYKKDTQAAVEAQKSGDAQERTAGVSEAAFRFSGKLKGDAKSCVDGAESRESRAGCGLFEDICADGNDVAGGRSNLQDFCGCGHAGKSAGAKTQR